MMPLQLENGNVNAYLLDRAGYAVRSFSPHLVYEVYGMAKMAHRTGHITKAQFNVLNTMLIRDALNNGEWMRQAE